jgi:hypothetical protein
MNRDGIPDWLAETADRLQNQASDWSQGRLHYHDGLQFSFISLEVSGGENNTGHCRMRPVMTVVKPKPHASNEG